MASDEFTVMPVRLLGFGFGIAEAAKYTFDSRFVDFCQTVGCVFVGVHVLHTAITKKAIPPIVGTVLFEGICSCIIPPVLSYYVCDFVARNVWSSHGIPHTVKKWLPFAFGLLTIPLCLKYVDPFFQELIVTKMLPAIAG